jgi:hypothetical protein
MDSDSLQNAYKEDVKEHPLLMKPDMSLGPVGLVRQFSGKNGGFQNNLIFGELGIAKGFLSKAPKITKILTDWITCISKNINTDEEIHHGFEILRNFLMNNRFDFHIMLEEDMTKTAVRHVLCHLSKSLDGNHERLHGLLKIYSPDRFGYEYGLL